MTCSECPARLSTRSHAPQTTRNIASLRAPGIAWLTGVPMDKQVGLQGRDATHRTRNLDTHLAHGCIQLFCHFPRQRRGSSTLARARAGAFQPNLEAAPRQRGGDKQ